MYYLVGYMDHYKPDAIVSDENPDNVKMYSQGGTITSRSRGYNTIEELKEGEKILEKPCVMCGGVAGTNYIGNQSMVERNMCFSCNFWEDRLHSLGLNNFIINGNFYTDSGQVDKPTKMFLGFGGRLFVIETFDGRIISTNNLWYGGRITQWFRDKFPDNAKFVTPKNYAVPKN